MINFIDNCFFLEGKDISYVMRIDKAGYLLGCYFGRKIARAAMQEVPDRFYCFMPWGEDGDVLDEKPQEAPTYGHTDLRCPIVSFKDRVCVLKYKAHRIYDGKGEIAGLPSSYDDEGKVQTLEIDLEDAAQGISVTLFYTVFDNRNTIARHIEVVNNSGEDVTVDMFYSMCLDFEHSDFAETHFAGRWGMEREKVTSPLRRGSFCVSNARGGSGHFMNPFVMLHDCDANEKSGDVYSFMLVYSGNHETRIDVDQRFRTRVLQGVNPFDFEKTIKSGEKLSSPESLLTFSHNGFGGMSRSLHEFIRENIVRGYWKKRERPILINNWEATYMKFDEEKVLSIARLAKKLGIELFVLDDGWFGKRNYDDSSLGDWYVNYEKLPHGITGLAERVEEIGLKFGLWFEPEMVSPNSDLYRAHPDWAIQAKGIAPALSRNQLVLDLTKKEVRDYIVDAVVKHLKEAKISYVKWDYNRYITDMPYKGYNFDYTIGLYDIFDRITSAAPEVLFEGCSGGGGRFDAGVLCYMPQIWTSDNTDAIERVYIQYGTSFGYPTSTMGSHVTASPNEYTKRQTPMKTRGDVALSGNFGYELDITKLGEEDLTAIAQQTEQCREVRGLVEFGDFYRLADPFSGNVGAWQVVSGDKKESFVCMTRIMFQSNGYFQFIRLDGLKKGTFYKDTYHEDKIYSADELMYRGVIADFPHGDFVTYTMRLVEV